MLDTRQLSSPLPRARVLEAFFLNQGLFKGFRVTLKGSIRLTITR